MTSPTEEGLFALALAKPATERAARPERECGEDQALLAAHEHPDPALATQPGLDVLGAAVRPCASATAPAMRRTPPPIT